MFDNGPNFKKYFTPLLKDSSTTTMWTYIKNPQTNTPVECIHQMIYNMIITKDIDRKIYEYIYPWGETLA